MQRIIYMAVVGALFIGAPMSALGANSGTNYMVRGGGTDSCGSWTLAREAAGKGEAVVGGQLAIDRVRRENWVMGYLSALNLWYLDYVPHDSTLNLFDLTESTDVPGLFAWIDNYCAAHPLDHLSEATKALTIELVDKWLTAHPARR